jgi:hypothetical protein
MLGGGCQSNPTLQLTQGPAKTTHPCPERAQPSSSPMLGWPFRLPLATSTTATKLRASDLHPFCEHLEISTTDKTMGNERMGTGIRRVIPSALSVNSSTAAVNCVIHLFCVGTLSLYLPRWADWFQQRPITAPSLASRRFAVPFPCLRVFSPCRARLGVMLVRCVSRFARPPMGMGASNREALQFGQSRHGFAVVGAEGTPNR